MADASDALQGIGKTAEDVWFFPQELRHGLNTSDLQDDVVREALATAYEYTRSVIPEWQDYDKYLAFMKTIVIAVFAEFRGDLIPQDGRSSILGYDLEGLLDTLFHGTGMRNAMSREFRAFLLMSVEKSSMRLDSELFRRYLHALADSPESWFRLRDCDALVRFTIISALSCNQYKDPAFSEEQWCLIGEIGCTLYDAVAFYKHRAEGETNSTFAYFEADARVKLFKLYRMLLWALDVEWATDASKRCILNFLRPFGGPLHMMTRRYRFVEDDLMIGKPETEVVVDLTRGHFKLWNRVEETADETVAQLTSDERYAGFIAQSGKLMFDGFCDLLQRNGSRDCANCRLRPPGTSRAIHQFGGIQLCRQCKEDWGLYMDAFPARVAAAFPEMKDAIAKAVTLPT
ncbi:uncharacterized protein F5Z01DRAFT_665596 [Emericellopsis atlantica]|uniref:Uncharacterized protein n=1 Tax=Emericellopsis atlantica TaxID=2614577 RepID=A0A9P7ZFL0_9HYPO|nr:uncharacterized protein F5Z01DRAFT_665596 [Emericellopsis atlantica]KAG9250655.1 hypothetical protein F5Z01DRAFT_665596 [Emericellopsis atlantica]